MKNNSGSLNTSLEITDALIDESWDWTATLNRTGLKNHTEFRINIGDSMQGEESLVGNVWKHWKERDINHKLQKFCDKEEKKIHRQFALKIMAICADEETKKLIVKEMMCAQNQELLQNMQQVIERKYGSKISMCLVGINIATAKHRYRISQEMASFISKLGGEVKETLDEMKSTDPLHNWFKERTDISSRMMMRIQNLATSISNKVRWIFLVEPGRPHSSLESFTSEFDILESFFDKAKLSPQEVSQKAFDQNASKVRSKKVECVDYTRVKLNDKTENKVRGDFIHANYISGGPLLNTFILTQAPLVTTTQDFWRMVWQEKVEYIFMLCAASNGQSFVPNETMDFNYCSVYWPRYQGDIMRFGKLTVKNDKVDATVDPLFNVTYLTLTVDDNPRTEVKVQHWHWDWKEFTDFDWPFRLLIRSRRSKYPTIVHCLDGCGKSGTLVLIEIFLMQLLRGTTSCDNPMITSAVFLRLQRRHAVANHMQYLYAYRTVLHWIEPFIISTYHRFVLGWLCKNSGFIGKYDQLTKRMAKSLLDK